MISSLKSVPRGACLAKPIRDRGEDGGMEGMEAPSLGGDSGGAAVDAEAVELMSEHDSDSDAEDDEIKASDAVFLSGRTEEDASVLEVHVYDGESLYVHHDVALPAFPLAVEWLRLGAGGPDSFAAVATFEPGIEIWDLDSMDPLEPAATLGGYKKRKKKTLVDGSHADAVTCLSWMAHSPTVLASGSADGAVKLWDVSAQRCATTWTHHGDKVQCVAWHRTEAACLASGGDDGTLAVRDARRADVGASFACPGKIEDCAWDAFRPERLVGATDAGAVICFDVRTAASPLWTVTASAGEVSAVAFSETYWDLMACAAVDGTAALWATGGGTPTKLAAKDLGVGALYALCFDAAEGATVAAGGASGTLALWRAQEDDAAVGAWYVEHGRTK